MSQSVEQVAVETLVIGSPNAAVSQVSREVLVLGNPVSHVSQMVVEVIFLNSAKPASRGCLCIMC